jgi:hypothetical protein
MGIFVAPLKKQKDLASPLKPETEFLNVIGTKVLRVFLLAIHSHVYPPPPPAPPRPPPLEQKWVETGF